MEAHAIGERSSEFCPARKELALLRHAARQRSDLALRRRQLPQGRGPGRLDLLYWDSDSVALPGPIILLDTRANTYLENNIKGARKGRRRRRYRSTCPRFKLPLICCPSEDKSVPWKNGLRVRGLIGKDVRFVCCEWSCRGCHQHPPAQAQSLAKRTIGSRSA